MERLLLKPIPPWARTPQEGDDGLVSFRGLAVPPGRIQLIPQQVLNAVRNRRDRESPDAWIYSTHRKVRDGEVHNDSGETVNAVPGREYWLFFVDLMPAFMWAHSAAYWAFDDNGAELATVAATIPVSLQCDDLTFVRDNLDMD